MAQQQLGIEAPYPPGTSVGSGVGSSSPDTAVGMPEHGAAPSSLLSHCLARWKTPHLEMGWDLMHFRQHGCKSRAVTNIPVWKMGVGVATFPLAEPEVLGQTRGPGTNQRPWAEAGLCPSCAGRLKVQLGQAAGTVWPGRFLCGFGPACSRSQKVQT